MTSFVFFVFVWPFLMIGLSVAAVMAAHKYYFDRPERQQHAAE
jgi:hypothetical protein